MHHASLAGASRAVDFLLSHWTLIHDGAPEPLMDAYEDEDQVRVPWVGRGWYNTRGIPAPPPLLLHLIPQGAHKLKRARDDLFLMRRA